MEGKTMTGVFSKKVAAFMLGATVTSLSPGPAAAQTTPGFGAEEFGFTQKQLVQAIEQVESLILKCMIDYGLPYITAHHERVTGAMTTAKIILGLYVTESDRKYGLG